MLACLDFSGFNTHYLIDIIIRTDQYANTPA